MKTPFTLFQGAYSQIEEMHVSQKDDFESTHENIFRNCPAVWLGWLEHHPVTEIVLVRFTIRAHAWVKV